MISEIGGCFTTLGPGGEKYTAGPDGKPVASEYADTNAMSLNWDNCGGFWNTPAHEAAHSMGLQHEMSRPDRDNFISIDTARLGKAADQYNRADESDTYGTVYDYGSNMHYSAAIGSAPGAPPTVVAKEKEYQHSMGSYYGPVFLDVWILNKYNDCIKSGISCENEGFPHPRAPSQKCYCPEGFAGNTCADREPGLNGAPAGCGQTLEAKPEWQKLEIDGPAAPDRKLTNQGMNGGQWPYAERAAACTWWIKAPAGKTVEVRVDSLHEKIKDQGWNLDCLSADCSYQGIEVKYGDMKRTGPRVCCPGHEKELGTVTSKGPLAIIRHWTLMDGIKATISYRTSDKPGECNDKTPNCAKNDYKHCANSKYENVMKRNCPKTCKIC